MPTATEENALVTREQTTHELQTTSAAAGVQQEIQGALVIAQRFPRDEDRAFQSLIRSCKRANFAADAQYEFPRGGQKVRGPSIYFAREFARVWGNIRHGCDILHDDEDSRSIRAWAWDLETNAKVTADDSFRKLVQRKNKKTNVTEWVKPDERDLRELTNRRAAIAKRNCILELLPSDLIQDALDRCDQTLQQDAAEDPDAFRKNTLAGFIDLNVSADQLKAYLGCPIENASPKQQAELRRIYKSLKDGAATWSDYFSEKKDDSTGKEAADKLREKLKQAKPAEQAAAQTPKEPPPPASAPDAPPDQDELELQNLIDGLKERIEQAQTEIEAQAVGADMVKHRDWLGEKRYAELLAPLQEKNRLLQAAKKRRG